MRAEHKERERKDVAATTYGATTHTRPAAAAAYILHIITLIREENTRTPVCRLHKDETNKPV